VTTFVPLLTRDQIDALPPRAREVVEYRKSGLSLNHVQGCPMGPFQTPVRTLAHPSGWRVTPVGLLHLGEPDYDHNVRTVVYGAGHIRQPSRLPYL
jgi:hypothetical protein